MCFVMVFHGFLVARPAGPPGGVHPAGPPGPVRPAALPPQPPCQPLGLSYGYIRIYDFVVFFVIFKKCFFVVFYWFL